MESVLRCSAQTYTGFAQGCQDDLDALSCVELAGRCSPSPAHSPTVSLIAVASATPRYYANPLEDLCLPCPKSRVCPLKGMTNVTLQSDPCPPGYMCGINTTSSSKFENPCPAGYWCDQETTPEDLGCAADAILQVSHACSVSVHASTRQCASAGMVASLAHHALLACLGTRDVTDTCSATGPGRARSHRDEHDVVG